MNIPDLTEMRRWQIEPGDRLIVTFKDRDLTPEDVQFIQRRVRGALALPADFPVLVISNDMTVEVAESDEDRIREAMASAPHRHLMSMPGAVMNTCSVRNPRTEDEIKTTWQSYCETTGFDDPCHCAFAAFEAGFRAARTA